jgi:hypothetical protein
MTIVVGAIIGSLVCGTSGYFAGYMKGASKWFDEIENREAATVLNIAAARTGGNVINFEERAMAIKAIRRSAVGLGHANLTRHPTGSSALERRGTSNREGGGEEGHLEGRVPSAPIVIVKTAPRR